MSRLYLGTCEYKWSHAKTHMEQIWVRREVGEEVFKTIEANDWEWTLLRSNSQSLPGEVYCRCDIYLDLNDTPEATLFRLKHNYKEV